MLFRSASVSQIIVPFMAVIYIVFVLVLVVCILGSDETKGARKVLTAAAMTYVAALAASILQLLRLLILAGGRRRDD